MFRASLVVWALIAGVATPAPADAKPKTAKTAKASKPAAKAAKPATTAKASATKRAPKSAKPTAKKQRVASSDPKKAKHESRVPTKSTGSNMPAGWAWPPNKTMVASGKACLQKLDELGVTYKKVEREGHIVEPITSDGMTFGGVRYVPVYGTGPRKLDCHLAVALATFGKDLASLGVRTVHFGSLYRWSKVRVGGLTKNILSRHALGLAMDITAFTDDQGRTAYVAKDYQKDDALLLAIEKSVNTSGKFRLLLTPKNDPVSHKDHFHLEANPNFTAFGGPVAHENIVSISDFGDRRSAPVLRDGAAARADQRLAQGPVTIEEIVSIAVPLARVRAHVHSEGIVHRDVKPENIFLVQRSQQRWNVKVVDFGIGRRSTRS